MAKATFFFRSKRFSDKKVGRSLPRSFHLAGQRLYNPRRFTYERTAATSGSFWSTATSYAEMLIPGWTTVGLNVMLGKYVLKTCTVNRELARMMSAWPEMKQMAMV